MEICIKILLILQIFGKCHLLSVQPEINVTEMARNVNHFNDEFFQRKTSELTITTSVNDTLAKYYFNELIHEILKPIQGLKLNLESVNENYRHAYAYFNIVLIDSYESFLKFDPGPKSKIEDFSEYYLLVFYGKSKTQHQEIQEIFDYCWRYYLVNVALLLQMEQGHIDLYTYYPFTKSQCHKAQMHVMNEHKAVVNLTLDELYPDKFRNFHNCTIMAALWNVPPYLTLPERGKNLEDFGGMEGMLLKVLADIFTFNIDYVIPPNNEQRGLVKKDGTLTGAIKMLNERVADLSLGSFRCTLERSTALSPTATFYQTMQVFTVLALKQPWTSYEVITYPFDRYIWTISIVLTLTLILSSYLLEYLRKEVLHFIYGVTSSTVITTNIIALTLGQPTTVEPQRNFARYFATMWVLLTFLLRSIYQGSLYDFLNSQKTINPPDTVQELTERRYRLIVNVATADSFSGVAAIRDKHLEVLIMNITDAGGYPLLEQNPDKPYVTGTPRDFLVSYVNEHQKFGVFHVLSETIFSQQLCVYFTKHSYLVVPFDRILLNLRSFGLIDYWARQVFDDRFLETPPEQGDEVILSLTQLSSIFLIAIHLYVLSTIVFVLEIVWFRLYNRNLKINENV